ncbi:unnamed protein product [Acanthoscelides obtectus]|uniref:Uncharacterized protein n=1 Tax=Acanthoscelides obtectus TaxID=200917 RepID=A0A9P0KKM5_ACAOB|nr:unnamed protein product [Acanthoscelides obtectus]CAK1641754.1 hypothetical protein AOBTE_LOCUS12610 [Acanthoscelides obtectus]
MKEEWIARSIVGIADFFEERPPQWRADFQFGKGRRDRGRLFSNDSTNDEDVLNNEGNFRELIWFRVESGDNLFEKNEIIESFH